MKQPHPFRPSRFALVRRVVLLYAATWLAAAGAAAQPETAPSPFAPTWLSLERHEVPTWYLDAKFGIFIHWGVYSVPAFGSEWYPRLMYQQGTQEFEHHVATYGPQRTFGYKDFIALFKAERYDPEQWAQLFRAAGAKFVVPVAEHHDGFALYASDRTTARDHHGTV